VGRSAAAKMILDQSSTLEHNNEVSPKEKTIFIKIMQIRLSPDGKGNRQTFLEIFNVKW
jgi:hypothetical protein